MNGETDKASGWDAIDRALRSLYADVEPAHWATAFRWRLGGPDPLDGVSAYPRLDPVPHWHYVGYGMSELYEKESDDPEVSGWGFEFTFRLARDPAETEAPVWGAQFLQGLAKYVFGTGKGYAPGDVVDVTVPIAYDRQDSLIRALAFVADPELDEISTPHGRVRFLQAVGLAGDEFAAAEEWDTAALLDVLAPRLPLFVTDLDRGSLLDEPVVATAVRAGSTRDGSSTGVVAVASLACSDEDGTVRLRLSTEDASRVARMLAARLPYERRLLLSTSDQGVEFVPGDRFGIAPGVAITVPPDAMDALLDVLRAPVGVHTSTSLPDVTVEIGEAIEDPSFGFVEPDNLGIVFTDPPGDQVLGLVEPDLGAGVAADSGGHDGDWAVDLFYGDPLSLHGPFVWVRTVHSTEPERSSSLMLRSEHRRLVEHAWLGEREPAVEPEPAKARLLVGTRELTIDALIEGDLLWVMQTRLEDSTVTVIGRGVDIGRIRLDPVGDLVPYQQRQNALYDRLSAALHDRPDPPNPALAGDSLKALRAVTDALISHRIDDDFLDETVDWSAEPMSPPPPNRATLTALHGVTITRDYEQAVRDLQRASGVDRETAELFVNRATEHVDFLNGGSFFDRGTGLRERACEETLRFYALDQAVSSQDAQLAWMDWRDHHYYLPELEDISAHEERARQLEDAWRAEWQAWVVAQSDG